jgi:uroporphyrinogen III methyltransferase/synthase
MTISNQVRLPIASNRKILTIRIGDIISIVDTCRTERCEIVSDLLENGMVALVGAGPGDPGLITLRGVRLLEQADVVVYDYLASPRLLKHAPNAEHLFVGKMASRHSMTQDQINALLIERAQAGHRVVRLKGGDPFVFGRGGEECEALAQAKVRYLVVPGITAAIAGPAYAGIPVTHRDFNSSFTLITGHEKEEQYKDAESKTRDSATGSSDLDWSAIAKLPCVAFYMGVKSLPRIAKRLIDNGMSPDTPAATIQWGTTTRQRTCVATVGSIADAVLRAGISAPAITIVGKVVSMRDTINWFESRPLFGKTVVVTRTRDQASDLTERLEALGARVIEAATIEVSPKPDQSALDSVLIPSLKSAAGQTVIFTSANGVRAARDRMRQLNLDARIFTDAHIAVIGEATARAVRDRLCIEPDIIPARATAEALADELIASGDVRGKRFVLLRAEIGRQVLVDRLRSAGAIVDDVAIYDTTIAAALPDELTEALAGGTVDWITFTSSSTAKNLITLLGDTHREKLQDVKLASIGPVTSDTLRQLGLSTTIEAEKADLGALVDAIVTACDHTQNAV